MPTVQSNLFNATTTPPVAPVFISHNPTNYRSRVTGVAGFGMDSAFGTVNINDNNNFVRVRIQVVNTLGDGTGDGTERKALLTEFPDRTVVVYDIAGWHICGANMNQGKSNRTVARHTAPGLGFHSRGDGQDNRSAKNNNCSNVLLWHFDHLFGGEAKLPKSLSTGNDAYEFNTSQNMAFINCGFAFGGDETFTTLGAANVTVYNTIFAHGLANEAGAHNLGSILEINRLTFARSGYYHYRQRTPLGTPYASEFPAIAQGYAFDNYWVYNAGVSFGGLRGHNNGLPYDGINWRDNLFVAGLDTPSGTGYLNISDSQNDDLSGWKSASKVHTSGHKFVGPINTAVQVSDFFLNTGARGGAPSEPFVNQSAAVPIAIAHGFRVTPITGFTDLEAVDLFQNNAGPRPANALGYYNELKSEMRNGVLGSGDRGSLAANVPNTVYAGSGNSGFDDIPAASVNNIQAIDNFLSANYQVGVDYTVPVGESGADFKVYTFKVTDGWSAIDEWLNQKNDLVMNPGWEI